MIDIQQYILPPNTPIVDAMIKIDQGGKGTAFVCQDGKLIGTLSDGDIRRFILKGGNISSPVDEIVIRDCVHLFPETVDQCERYFQKYRVKAIPVVDQEGKLLSIRFDDKAVAQYPAKLDLPVVIMAGGKGTRLYPYTKVLPKPLIPIRDVPITEHIMQQFLSYGCNDFTMIVNHQKNMIKAYFAEQETSYRLTFVDEDTPLGTGGGLKLLEGRISGDFFFTNCDTLIEADYDRIFRFHQQQGNLVTMVCATKNITVPYGTVTVEDGGKLSDMVEKPRYSFLINTGFYLLGSRVLDYIPQDTFIHITDIIERCRQAGEPVGVFPISEVQWSDMGQISGLNEMERKKESWVKI